MQKFSKSRDFFKIKGCFSKSFGEKKKFTDGETRTRIDRSNLFRVPVISRNRGFMSTQQPRFTINPRPSDRGQFTTRFYWALDNGMVQDSLSRM